MNNNCKQYNQQSKVKGKKYAKRETVGDNLSYQQFASCVTTIHNTNSQLVSQNVQFHIQ